MADEPSVSPTGGAPPGGTPVHIDEDTKQLHEMGYAQELDRRMSGFSNFAISFTIISILSGCLTVYQYGLLHGGPPVMTWGWLGVGIVVIFVGMSMAEICSSFPTAGGLYYWAAKLAPGNSAPIWSWFTGWFNLVGQVAVTAGISFGCAYSVSAFLAEYTGDAAWFDPEATIAILAVILFAQGLLNTFGIKLVALLNDISVWWHLIGVAVIVAVLYWAPESGEHQTMSFVFGSEGWKAFEGLSGFTAPVYVALLGLLNAQYTFTGYDASAHVSEETIRANVQAAKGIVNSIWVSLIAGFVLLVGVSWALPKTFPVSFGGTEFASVSDLSVGHHTVGGGFHDLRRPDHRPAAHPDRHRGAVLLRHVVRHGQLAHDLRVLAGRRRARLASSGTTSARSGASPCARPGSAPSAPSSSPSRGSGAP